MTERVAGVDEAGRGPLAGPVVVAAVILPEEFDTSELDDSKKLTAEKREELAIVLKQDTIYSIELADVEEIDRLNILWATMAAMVRALEKLPVAPTKALIDGNRLPRTLICPTEAIVKGDALHPCISAASILAKTHRDHLMIELARAHPGYGFEKHFGYATPEHLAALEELGPCPIHRKSFAPCRPEPQYALDL